MISNRLYDFRIGIIIAVSERLDGAPTSSFLDYSFNALAYRYYKADVWQQASNFVDEYSKSGKGDAIVSIYMFPLDLIGVTSESPSSGWVNIAGVRDIMSRKLENVFAPLDGYTPKNNKMYAYPYRTLNVCSPGSSEKEYRYEYFDTNFLENNGPFNLFSALGGSAPVVAIPRAYKGLNVNYDETITTSAYPTCSWINDTFKNWYAQNQMGINFNAIVDGIGGVLGVASGIGTGNWDSAVQSAVGAVSSVGNALISVEQHKIIPDSARGNTGYASAFYNNGYFDFVYFPKCIRYEFAKRIDDYFTMYGYKTLQTKVPNLYGRRSWNFVKCTEANLIDSIPVVAHNRIKQAFETGVTFWHTNDIKNYALDNSII